MAAANGPGYPRGGRVQEPPFALIGYGFYMLHAVCGQMPPANGRRLRPIVDM